MKTTENGLNLCIAFEKLKLKPYKDSKGLWTVGVGHLINQVKEPELMNPTGITPMKARMLFQKDIAVCEILISHDLDVELNSNQFDSLVCYALNIGIGNFLKGTLFKMINRQAPETKLTVKTFWRTHWITGDGNPNDNIPDVGLDWRRYVESEYFYTETGDDIRLQMLVALANAGAPNKTITSWNEVLNTNHT